MHIFIAMSISTSYTRILYSYCFCNYCNTIIKLPLFFLYSQQVTPQESGIYTCVCKNLGNISLQARSVQLEIKREWSDLWANDYTVIIIIFIIINNC